jgi:exopolysaccharide biosynthesis polyprenyl glycosylphosphotransferase
VFETSGGSEISPIRRDELKPKISSLFCDDTGSEYGAGLRQARRIGGAEMYRNQHWWLRLALVAWDCAASIFAFMLAGLLRFGEFQRFFTVTNAAELTVVIVLASFAAFMISRMYRNFFSRGYLYEITYVISYNFWVFAIILLYTFSTKNTMVLSRLTFVYSVPISVIFLYGSHIVIKNVARLRAGGKRGWKLLIVTDAENVDQTCRNVQGSNGWKNRATGVLMADRTEADAQTLRGIPLIDLYADDMEYLRQHPVDEVLIAVRRDRLKTGRLEAIIGEMAAAGAVVSVKIEMPEIAAYNVTQVTKLGTFNIASFADREYDFAALILKRGMDIVGGIVGLLIAFVLGLFVAPAILLDSPGPVFFKQQRVGRNGRIFTMYKFRSMRADAEQRKRELMGKNKMSGLMFKVDDDPRVTRVGRFIRKTSIDEYPQFFNVLIGDMSLVGTRPPTLDEYEHYTSAFKKRLSFKPGLTGIWQTSGRNEVTSFEDVMSMDLEYIRKWSVLLDVKLILKTIRIVLLGRGAE